MSDEPNRPDRPQEVNIKISDDELRGRYSNLLRITHTREEFFLDFINLVPPQGHRQLSHRHQPGPSQAHHPCIADQPDSLRRGPRHHRRSRRSVVAGSLIPRPFLQEPPP